MIKDTPFCVRGECRQQIKITVRPEIAAQGRAEKRKFFYLPLAAKFFEDMARDVDWQSRNHVDIVLCEVGRRKPILRFHEIARAIRNAAPAARLPISAVCKALRSGREPVKRPLIKPKTNKAISVRPT